MNEYTFVFCFESFRAVIYINWDTLFRHAQRPIYSVFPLAVSHRVVLFSRTEECMNQRTSGRTRARACRKRERRAWWRRQRRRRHHHRRYTNLRAFRHRRVGVARKGMDDCGGRIPLSRASRGVSLCVRRRQVKEAVADLSINGRLEPRLLKDLESFCVHLYLYLSLKKVSNYTTYIIITKYLQLNKTILQMT